ncbi:MAG TPA: GNAT family N-acetyltransferase, partial [Actinomycetales bacterium]|nr:GNAT family N-acetyltransferase [Actinomycetales bacterium]
MTEILESARWRELSIDQFYEIVRLRYAVYALEQRVDAEDFDEIDRAASTEHWWIRGHGPQLNAYLRLLKPPIDEPTPPGASRPDWAVGRMVVRQDLRRRGLAQRLLLAALDAYPDDSFILHAQAYTKSLYEKLGFRAFGEPFDEAGIPH